MECSPEMPDMSYWYDDNCTIQSTDFLPDAMTWKPDEKFILVPSIISSPGDIHKAEVLPLRGLKTEQQIARRALHIQKEW